MNLYTKPWILVLTGVILTTMSAVLTNYAINENNSIIGELSSQASSIDRSIDNIWKNSLALEHKRDLVLITYPLTSSVDKNINQHIRSVFQDLDISGKTNKEIVDNLLIEIAKNKSSAIEKINDFYEKKINIEEEISSIKSENSWLSNIALFLQIIGLILVLSKDLAGD